MREIKFRAWDKSKELLVNAELILGIRFDRRHQEPALITYTRKKMNPTMEISHLDKIYCNEFELMQFTGLLDKNGTEIYEGDVVQISGHPLQRDKQNWAGINIDGNYEVYWDEQVAGFSIDRWKFVEVHKYCEIIGNIHEHPHLLGCD